MSTRFDAGEDFSDPAGWVNDEGIARGQLRAVVFHHRAIGRRYFCVRVREQLEVQSFFRTEALVRFGRIYTHSQNHGIDSRVLRQVSLEVMRLECAARSKILRIEVEHHPLPSIILQAGLIAFIACELEVRSRCTDLRQISSSMNDSGQQE